MFRTMREAELMRGLIRPTDGFQFWSLVELETVWPWFHVETIDCGGGRRQQGVVLAPNVQLLSDLVRCGNRTARVKQVQIVTPSSMNGSGAWRMDILVCVFEVLNAEGRISGHDYQVAGGRVYSTVVDEESRALRALIYSSDVSP